jgi:toxin ParE1/3/4
MRAELSAFIEADLDAIAAWIAQDNPARAVTFLREIREAILRVGENPLHYQLRSEIDEHARIAMVGNYVILFQVVTKAAGEVVRIERIVFGGHNLPKIMQ